MTSTRPTVWRAAMLSRGRQLREEARHVEAGQIGETLAGSRPGSMPAQVVAHAVVERAAALAAKRIKDRAIDLRRAKIGHQRIEAVCGAGGDLLVIVGGEMAERRTRFAIQVRVGGNRERKPQLIEIFVVREREVLVEPFGRKQFGGGPPMRAAVGQLDAHAHKTLRRLASA